MRYGEINVGCANLQCVEWCLIRDAWTWKIVKNNRARRKTAAAGTKFNDFEDVGAAFEAASRAAAAGCSKRCKAGPKLVY